MSERGKLHTDIAFLENGIRLRLLEGGTAISIPTSQEELNGLYQPNSAIVAAVSNLRALANQVTPLASNSLTAEDLIHFSEADISAPAVAFSENDILIAYKTIAAVRYWNLESHTGLSQLNLESLGVPRYCKIRTRLTTHQNFGDPNFRLVLRISDEFGAAVSVTNRLGHFYSFSNGSSGLVSPAIHRLIERMKTHELWTTQTANRSSAEAQRKEYSDLRAIAIAAHSQMDTFLSEQNVIILERLPYEFQRGLDGNLLVAPVMPDGLESMDNAFQEELNKLKDEQIRPYLNLKRKQGSRERTLVVLAKTAWTDYTKIKDLNLAGQGRLQEALENPEAALGQAPRNRILLAHTFSDRIVGFIFGKVVGNRSDTTSGTNWTAGYEHQSTIIRSISGATIPVDYTPTPDLYETFKSAYLDLSDQLDKYELQIATESELLFTPLPPELERTIEVPQVGMTFGLTELYHCCKRIEIENTPELHEDEIPRAKEVLARAKSSQSLTVNWSSSESSDSPLIPVESLRRAVSPRKRRTASEHVSPAIGKFEATIGVAPQWSWRQADASRYGVIPGFLESVKLRPHQTEGLAWLHWLHDHVSKDTSEPQRKGALLADDMGLGKTIQVLGLVASIKSLPGIGQKPILIVAPVSLINDSWIKDGFQRFLKPEWTKKHLHPVTSDVLTIDREELLAEARRVNDELVSESKSLSDCEISESLKERLDSFALWAHDKVLLTSYERLRMNSVLFASVPFSLAILDEAQKIKNVGVLQANAAKALKADMCIAMSGTPIENSLMDLWGIMDFVLPGKLGDSSAFRKDFIERLSEAPIGSDKRAQLRNTLESRLAPVWLRRTKKEVFKNSTDLPDIVHYDSVTREDGTVVNEHAVPMSSQQRTLYDEFMGIFVNSTGGHRLAGIRSLLEVCAAPWLRAEIMPNWDSHSRLFEICPKLKQSIHILEQIRSRADQEGRKVVIFANVIQIQNSLAYLIADWNRKTGGIVTDVEVYNGEASPQLRSDMLERFKSAVGFKVLIISPKAGGAGLNIVEANNVIHYTREWNPALERQATDRVYRIGQTRRVHVYYPTTLSGLEGKPSAEEHLSDILRAKRQVMDDFTVSLAETSLSEADFTSGVKGEYTDDFRVDGGRLNAMSPTLFEKLLKVLYSKRSMTTHWIGESGDRGADVVCLGESDSFLIQAKHSANGAVQHTPGINEIRGAKSVYESRYQKAFKLVVATNTTFSEEAALFSYQEGDRVELLDGRAIAQLLDNYVVLFSEVIAVSKSS